MSPWSLMDRELKLTESIRSNSYRTNLYSVGLSVCRGIRESLQLSTVARCLGQPQPHAHRGPTVGNSTNEEGSIPWPSKPKGCNYSVFHWREGVPMFGESGGLRKKLHSAPAAVPQPGSALKTSRRQLPVQLPCETLLLMPGSFQSVHLQITHHSAQRSYTTKPMVY